MRQILIWINYDLGLRGDYEGLYAWLDSIKAKECGSNMAAVSLELPENQNLYSWVEKEIRKSVKVDESKDRVYVIWNEKTEDKSKVRGKFIIGKRKRAPWEGYAVGVGESEDIEI